LKAATNLSMYGSASPLAVGTKQTFGSSLPVRARRWSSIADAVSRSEKPPPPRVRTVPIMRPRLTECRA